jgi:hypothetical protein
MGTDQLSCIFEIRMGINILIVLRNFFVDLLEANNTVEVAFNNFSVTIKIEVFVLLETGFQLIHSNFFSKFYPLNLIKVSLVL